MFIIRHKFVPLLLTFTLAILYIAWSAFYIIDEHIEYELPVSQPPTNVRDPNDSRLTLVLVTTLMDSFRVMLLLSSLKKHIKSKDIYELLIVIPDQQTVAFDFLHGSGLFEFPIRVIRESKQLKIPQSEEYKPYAKQMLIKLAVANIVNTRFYLTLDSDLVLHRDFDVANYIANGRAYLEQEPRTVHSEWWDASKRVLKIDKCDPDDVPLIGVTPAFVSTKISLLTLERLKYLYGSDYIRSLLQLYLKNRWTEYTLYRICGCFYGLLDEYHYFGSIPLSFWVQDVKGLKQSFKYGDNAVAPWLVVQSRANLSPLDTIKTIYS